MNVYRVRVETSKFYEEDTHIEPKTDYLTVHAETGRQAEDKVRRELDPIIEGTRHRVTVKMVENYGEAW